MSARPTRMSVRAVRETTLTCSADEKNPHPITVKKVYVFEGTENAYATCPVHHDLVKVIFRPYVFPSGFHSGGENKRV